MHFQRFSCDMYFDHYGQSISLSQMKPGEYQTKCLKIISCPTNSMPSSVGKALAWRLEVLWISNPQLWLFDDCGMLLSVNNRFIHDNVFSNATMNVNSFAPYTWRVIRSCFKHCVTWVVQDYWISNLHFMFLCKWTCLPILGCNSKVVHVQ